MDEYSMHTLHDRFQRVMKLAVRLEQTPRPFGTDELLTATEIHLVEIIGENGESLSVTDLAGLLGVTKGAVSQTLKKLENKGLTTKHPTRKTTPGPSWNSPPRARPHSMPTVTGMRPWMGVSRNIFIT